MLETCVLGWAHVRRILEVEDALAAPARTIEVVFKDLVHLHVFLVVHQIHTARIAAQSLIWSTGLSVHVAEIWSLEEIASAEENDVSCVKYISKVDQTLLCQVFPVVIALMEGGETDLMRVVDPSERQVTGLVFICPVMQVESRFWEPRVLLRWMCCVKIAARTLLCTHVVVKQELSDVVHLVRHFKHGISVLVGLLLQLPRIQIAHEIERCIVHPGQRQY